MTTPPDSTRRIRNTRRLFLQKSGFGLGGAALAGMFRADAAGANTVDPLAKFGLHHAPKAKHVIYIHLVGAPSHLDLYDFKPELQKRSGQLCPDEFFQFWSGASSAEGGRSMTRRGMTASRRLR